MKKIVNSYKMMVTPEESRKVQEVCFACGVRWFDGGRFVKRLDYPYLYIKNGKLTPGRWKGSFERCHMTEVTPSEFIGGGESGESGDVILFWGADVVCDSGVVGGCE